LPPWYVVPDVGVPPCAPHASIKYEPVEVTVNVWIVPVLPVPVGRNVVTGEQTLPTQCSPPVHALPHAPQFVSSLVRSRHDVPHAERGATHFVAQLPAAQTVPVAQTVPHVPQLLPSFCRSLQTPLQSLSVPAHTHLLPLHVSADPHVFPQPPQFEGSIVVSTHTAPQIELGSAHAMHVPAAHFCPVVHT
jgi:hypothetical protein